MEIEKKYKIAKLPDDYEENPCFVIEQGYLCCRPTVRIRKMNDDYILTYKSKFGKVSQIDKSLCASNEVELELTKEAYEHLKEKIDGFLVEKNRYKINLDNGLVAELDIFKGFLEGLKFVEVEFESEQQALDFNPPEWFGEDVSADYRYRNSSLSHITNREDVEKLL